MVVIRNNGTPTYFADVPTTRTNSNVDLTGLSTSGVRISGHVARMKAAMALWDLMTGRLDVL